MEHTLVIQGGHPLAGSVSVRGSKNAASKLMIASLLSPEQSVIDNVPLSAEIDITQELCEVIGSNVAINDHRYTIQTSEVKNSLVTELSRKNRIPILATGPLLHRRGFAEIPVLGGCPIGHRPINLHIEAFNKMGIKIERRENSYYAEVPSRIVGAEIEFAYPSVGATESVLLTAVLAEGKTVIRNAAVEPEILNLIAMLHQMGAEIIAEPDTRCITVTGVARLTGTKIHVVPDRNEIVSFAAAALATHGDIFVENIEPELLTTFLGVVRALGAKAIQENGGIRFKGKDRYNPVYVETAPHPAFMTDWQQPFCVVLTQAGGESIIHETVYEDRFGYTKDLRRMGADIDVSDECLGGNACRFQGQTFNHSARIRGATRLKGTDIVMPDIRAGMAHIVAGLAAQGESVVSGVAHIDRGYEKMDERLRMLGADIKRIEKK